MSARRRPVASAMSVEQSIVVTVPATLAELVTDRMWQWGVRAVSETSTGDGLVEITTSVGNDGDAIDRALTTLDPAWRREVRTNDASAVQVDPQYLSPTWYAPGKVCVPAALHPIALDDQNTLVTVIDPGAAFGLGDHPTTSTSMAMLARHIELGGRSPGGPASLLDVGCGSGALAVLAAQLGVATIRAVDIADAAVEATRRNAELNGVSNRIDVDTTPIAELGGTYDVIMANILAPVLIAMSADFERLLAPGGSLIISGILERRHDHVLEALAPLRAAESIESDGWITIRLR